MRINNLNLLREFITLSKNLNFSKTAEQFYITQSALSKHMALLEEEIGATLLTRSHHNVELTAIGNIFLDDVIAIVNRYDESIIKIRMALEKLEEELKIGYLHEHTKNFLPSTVQLFKKKFPRTKLTLTAGLYGELPQRLKNNDVDLILTLNLDRDMLSWCDTYALYKEYLCAAICTNHPLAKQKNITIDDLKSERILMPQDEYFNGYATLMNEIFNLENLSQDRIIPYECIYSSLLMVEAGDGIAILPKMFKPRVSEKICFIPLSESQYSFDVVAAWRKSDNNPAIKKFIKILSHIKV